MATQAVKDQPQLDKTAQQGTSGGVTKEIEPKVEEKRLMSEIIQTSEAIDREHLKKVEEDISEAKSASPEPVIPPDVADSGVHSPQSQAEEVIHSGSTVNLPISENEYEEGLHQKMRAKVSTAGVVFGVNSLIALVAFVGRMIKIGHNHAMKVIFKRGGEQ